MLGVLNELMKMNQKQQDENKEKKENVFFVDSYTFEMPQQSPSTMQQQKRRQK